MLITRGIVPCAKKIVTYGVEGIGKSTFTSRFPDPVFCDLEGSTRHMDVARTSPDPLTFAEVKSQIRYFIDHPTELRTFVLDTADALEALIAKKVCDELKIEGREDISYGKAYVYVWEEFGRTLNLLQDLCNKGVIISVNAHAVIRKFEQPDASGSYDRYELKLQNGPKSNNCALLKEWADIVLFANYKQYVITPTNKKGEASGKSKVTGGTRVMYTSHHPCWDAKNRFGLADELPFDYNEIAHIIEDRPIAASSQPSQHRAIATPSVTFTSLTEEKSINTTSSFTTPALTTSTPEESSAVDPEEEGLPQELLNLMHADGIPAHKIRFAVALKGYYPNDMPIKDYDPDFINGCLIAAWDGVKKIIADNDADLPF